MRAKKSSKRLEDRKYCYLCPELKGKKVGKFQAELDNSIVFSLFCTKLYGRDLGQMNRMDTSQLDKLLYQLYLTKNDHF